MSKKILFIDCASMGWVSLGLVMEGECRGEINLEIGKAQASLLPGLAGSFLGAFGLAAGDVDLFAAAVGPGSFTGIKVGLTFVQFLAWAGGKKVIPLSSLESAAFSTGLPPGTLVCPLSGAGGGKAYSGLFRLMGEARPPEAVMAEGVYSRDELAEGLMPFSGDAPFFIADSPVKLGHFIPPAAGGGNLRKMRPGGGSAALLAWIRRGEAMDPGNLAARYFKDPDVGRPAS